MEHSQMDSNRQTCLHRSGRLSIYQLPAAEVKRINEVNEQSTLRATHSQGTPAPKITSGFSVLDIEREQCHMILVHRVDYRSGFSPSIDTFVYVYHGPVHYENESGVIVTDDDLTDIHGGVRAYFTKRTEFADQSEYRFAVELRGDPSKEIFKLDISEELRQLTSPTR